MVSDPDIQELSDNLIQQTPEAVEFSGFGGDGVCGKGKQTANCSFCVAKKNNIRGQSKSSDVGYVSLSL